MGFETILITGVGGFLGRHLVSVLHQEMPTAHIIGAARRAVTVDCPSEIIDFTSAAEVAALMRTIQPGIIFHLIGAAGPDDVNHYYEANVLPSICLFEAVLHEAVKPRIVLIGSAAEYGQVEQSALPVREDCELKPITTYGLSKSWQTLAAKYYARRGVDVAVARIFNLIGGGLPERLSLGAFASQLQSLSQKKPPRRLLAGNLDNRRDYVDVGDACRALVAVVLHGERGEVYNVCSGRSVRIGDVLSSMIACTGLEVEVVLDRDRLRGNDQPDVYGSYEKLELISGWRPNITLQESIARMMQAAPLAVDSGDPR
jgi:GDP-4-dehydro-6-deoxy-D-mannose reductase